MAKFEHQIVDFGNAAFDSFLAVFKKFVLLLFTWRLQLDLINTKIDIDIK